MLSPLEEKLLGLMVIVLMIGMGATLTWSDFRNVFKNPKGIIIGFLSQFGLMPAIAFGLAVGLALPIEAAIALIMVGCTPGGTTSNMFAYFSKGDVSLSVSMTVASTFGAILMMPLLLALYTSGLDLTKFGGTEFTIPYNKIVATLVAVIIPVIIGIFIRKKSLRAAEITEKVGSYSGIAVIIFLIATWVPKNSDLLSATSWQIYTGAVVLGLCGFLLGYVLSKILQLSAKLARTVALETGIQNTPVTIAIIITSFPKVNQPEFLHLPLLYALGIVLTSSLVTVIFRKMAKAD